MKIKYLLTRYIGGLLLQLTILFAIYAATLAIVGVPNVLVIAFLCALFNVIPFVGPLIGGALMAVLTMLTYLDQDFVSFIIPKVGWVLLGLGIGSSR